MVGQQGASMGRYINTLHYSPVTERQLDNIITINYAYYVVGLYQHVMIQDVN